MVIPRWITTDYDFDAVSEALSLKGHIVVPRGGETSGLSIIQIMANGTFMGGADPRRDGSAAGRTTTEPEGDDDDDDDGEEEGSGSEDASAIHLAAGPMLVVGVVGSILLNGILQI
jgi:hypothetical protein